MEIEGVIITRFGFRFQNREVSTFCQHANPGWFLTLNFSFSQNIISGNFDMYLVNFDINNQYFTKNGQ